jgi:uncharacterized protein (UPF0335 family)
MPREKKNGSPEAQPSEATPGFTDAGVETPQNTRPEDAAECFLTAKDLKRRIAQLSQTLSATYARFENMGVDVESVKECLKLEKHDDPPGKMRRIMTMAAILDLIPTATEASGQMTILPGLTIKGLDASTKEKVSLAQAYNDGYNTGLSGGVEDNNRFDAGSEHRVKWSLGHIDGQAQRAINKPGSENVVHASTEKRGRGRPKKVDRVDDRTQLERDEAAFRGQEPEVADVEPVTGALH